MRPSASRISFTAEPMAAMMAPIDRYASRQKTSRKPMSIGSSRPNEAKAMSAMMPNPAYSVSTSRPTAI